MRVPRLSGVAVPVAVAPPRRRNGQTCPGRGATPSFLAGTPGTLRRGSLVSATAFLQQGSLWGGSSASAASSPARISTLQGVSSLWGFSEPSAFSRAFRRWTGQPPSAARDAVA